MTKNFSFSLGNAPSSIISTVSGITTIERDGHSEKAPLEIFITPLSSITSRSFSAPENAPLPIALTLPCTTIFSKDEPAKARGAIPLTSEGIFISFSSPEYEVKTPSSFIVAPVSSTAISSFMSFLRVYFKYIEQLYHTDTPLSRQYSKRKAVHEWLIHRKCLFT